MVIPVQDIDIHTNKAVFYKLHLVQPSNGSSFAMGSYKNPFSVEVLVYDSEFEPPYSSVIRFPQQFAEAEIAFEHGLKWVLGHSAAHSHEVIRINNPCNCEFLDKAGQATVLARFGIGPVHQVNGA